MHILRNQKNFYFMIFSQLRHRQPFLLYELINVREEERIDYKIKCYRKEKRTTHMQITYIIGTKQIGESFPYK